VLQSEDSDAEGEGLSEEEEVVTRILSRLKDSPASFEQLANSLASLEIKSMTKLVAVVKLVFEAALSDLRFQDVYARLCCFLSESTAAWHAAFLRVEEKHSPDVTDPGAVFAHCSGCTGLARRSVRSVYRL
jgi:hypothetical protein